MTKKAKWLDVETPGGTDCVAAALATPRDPEMKRFEVRFMEDEPGHKFFYSRVIEAPDISDAERLAESWARLQGDDIRGYEEL